MSGKHINVCCWKTDRLIILYLNGKVKSIHGPEINVIGHSREAANRDGSVKGSLSSPILCQEDDEGNVLIADYPNDRLLLFTTDCKWYDVTPGGVNRLNGALEKNGRLYVCSWVENSIIMFKIE